MIRTWEPKCGISRHSLPADKDILKSFIKGMAHMELTRYIRRGDNDSIRFFLRIDMSLKALIIHPEFVDLVLYFLRFVELGKFFFH